jgi:hypothetical protein
MSNNDSKEESDKKNKSINDIEFPEIKGQYICGNLFGFADGHDLDIAISNHKELIDKFLQFKVNEKIVIKYQYTTLVKDFGNTSYRDGNVCIYLTNYSRCLCIFDFDQMLNPKKVGKRIVNYDYNKKTIPWTTNCPHISLTLDEINYWLPKSYLKIIGCSQPEIRTLLRMLMAMKDDE